MTSPFLHWVTRKPSVVEEMAKLVPKEYGAYYEPFLGGGALFFLLQPSLAYLSDSLRPLVEVYREVRDNPSEVYAALFSYVEDWEPDYPGPRAALAAKFISATWGNKVPLTLQLQQCSAALQGTYLISTDYRYLGGGRPPQPGDLVYLDPPFWYGDKRDKKQTTAWDTFQLREHRELQAFAYQLAAEGVLVMISLADSPQMENLYPPQNTHRLRTPYWKGTELLVRM